MGFELLWAMAPDEALWSLLRFERGLEACCGLSFFCCWEHTVGIRKQSCSQLALIIPLDKARGAALGPWALEVLLLVDCFGSLSSSTGTCPRKEGSMLTWEKMGPHNVNEQRWKQLVLHQPWVLRTQIASSEAWSLPSNKRCFSGSIGSKSHCLFRGTIPCWLPTTSPCSSCRIWRNCVAGVCTMGGI